MKKVVLHIGTEKTGTTSIQSWFYDHQGMLSEQNILYPKSGGYITHEKLICYAMDDSKFEDVRRRHGIHDKLSLSKFREVFKHDLAEEIKENANFETLIFSTEHAHSRLTTVKEIKLLMELIKSLGEFDIQIIVYIRRQDLMAISRYNTAILSGSVTADVFPNEYSLYFDYFELLNRWSEVVGKDKISVRIFEPSFFVQGKLFADFLTTIGLSDWIKVGGFKAKNQSVDVVALKFVQLFNEIIPSDPAVAVNQQRTFFETAILSSRSGSGKKIINYIKKNDAIRFLQIYNEGNEKLKKEWFPDRDSLFTNDLSMYSEVVDTNKYDFEDAVHVAADIFGEIAKILGIMQDNAKKMRSNINNKNAAILQLKK